MSTRTRETRTKIVNIAKTAETAQVEIEKIDNALETHTELKTDVLFYRKEGKGKPSKL